MKNVARLLITVAVTVGCCSPSRSNAWSPNPFSMLASNRPHLSTILHLEDEQDETIGISLGQTRKVENRDEIFETRRRFLNAAAMNVCFFGAAAPVALAASTTESERTRYISGKAPQVPGAKPPDKNNLKGTRKDPDFLRSIADCRNQCQNSSSGPDGLAKSKEDCLSECQDICCKTYEQCTFNIVPRI